MTRSDGEARFNVLIREPIHTPLRIDQQTLHDFFNGEKLLSRRRVYRLHTWLVDYALRCAGSILMELS